MSAVDVFEVGRQQLRELVDHDISFEFGDYVVVSMGAVFGRVSDELTLVEHYFYKYWACHHAENMQRISCIIAAETDKACVCEYEVWHVVDDDQLWGSWEARVLDAKIETQRKDDACRISLDNGHTFLDPVRDDADFEDLIDYLDVNPQVWDVLVSCYMEDDAREFTHLTSDYTGMLPDEHMSTAMIRAFWLCDYLMNAYSDLVY